MTDGSPTNPSPPAFSGQALLFRDLGTGPSFALADVAATFVSDVTVSAGATIADAKSALEVVTLAAVGGTILSFRAVGADSARAVDTLITTVTSDFPSLPALGYAFLSQALDREASITVARAASKYSSDITASVGGMTANAKDVEGLTKLTAEAGWVLHLEARGSDSKEAIDDLLAVLVPDWDS